MSIYKYNNYINKKLHERMSLSPAEKLPWTTQATVTSLIVPTHLQNQSESDSSVTFRHMNAQRLVWHVCFTAPHSDHSDQLRCDSKNHWCFFSPSPHVVVDLHLSLSSHLNLISHPDNILLWKQEKKKSNWNLKITDYADLLIKMWSWKSQTSNIFSVILLLLLVLTIIRIIIINSML